MVRPLLAIFPLAVLVGLVGCDGGDSPDALEDLPPGAHILPGALGGVIGFPLLIQSEAKMLEASFFSVGREALVVESAEIVGDTLDVFSMTTPASLTVEPRKGISFPITFRSPGRGIYLADLVVKSNAVDYPELRIQLVAPSAGVRVPEEPDIQPFETTVEVQASSAWADIPVALVRIYNLGGMSLQLAEYALEDPSNFRFLSGTAVPGLDCSVSGACVPANVGDGQGCCGGLHCVTEDVTPAPITGTCSPIFVSRGSFVGFGVTWTNDAVTGVPYSAGVQIRSNDPKPGRDLITVTVNGTR